MHQPLRRPEQTHATSSQAAVQKRAASGAGLDYPVGVYALSPASQPGYDAQCAALSPDVQMKGGGGNEGVQQAAAQGVSGSGGALPFLSIIQKSFGQHDVSGVSAHVGGGATAACKTIGAEAYATGNSVAFGGSPTLHTAAHEAAHVIQQRAGVSLSGGVGRVGDTYEQHADAVADLVVQGKSAEGLLDGMAPTRGQDSSSRAVQRVSPTHEHGVYGGGHKGTNDFKFADGNGLLGKLVGKLFKRIINKRHEILDKLSLIPGPIGKGFKVAKLTLSIVEAAIEKDPSKLLEFFGENFKGNLSRAFKPEGVNIEELEVPEGFQKLLKELEENTKQLQNTHELQQPNQDAGKDDEEAKPQGNSR